MVGECRLLVVPRARQVVLVCLPDPLQLLDVGLRQDVIKLQAVVDSTTNSALRVWAMPLLTGFQNVPGGHLRVLALAHCTTLGLTGWSIVPRLVGSRRGLSTRCWSGLRRRLPELLAVLQGYEAVLPRQLLPLGDALQALACAVVLLFGNPSLDAIPVSLARLPQHVCCGEPNTEAGTWSEIAHVSLALRNAHVRWPCPDQEDEPEARLHAGDRMDIVRASAEGYAGALSALVASDRVLVPPLCEELDLAPLVAAWVREGHRTAVAAVGRLLLAPEDVGALLGRHHLVLAADPLAAPPDRVELDVVGVWGMPDVVRVADSRLVEHHWLSVLLDHGIHHLLRFLAERVEVAVCELRLLLVPRPGQVVPVSPPKLVQSLDVGLGQDT
mmetsp:Transcript_91748/g.268543  ORF Transcript_91748/g.268543 Transcript_91748/m.268543 type:complete len:385 (-) Transcript_91748:548-1702(-)